MTIELIIRGNHATDIAHEIGTLADMLSGSPCTTPVTQTAAQPPVPAEPEVFEEPVEEKPKKLTAKQQDAAVAEMVEGNYTDERYELLSKARKKKVDDAFDQTSPAEDAVEDVAEDEVVTEEPTTDQVDTDVDAMFEDELVVEENTISHDDIRDIMSKVGKDKNGDAITDNLAVVRKIITANVPKGEKVMVANIPEGKLAAVHAEISKLDK